MYARFQQGARRRLVARRKLANQAWLRPLGFESLEERRLLAVTASSSAGVLTVNLGSLSDFATITATAASVAGAQSIQVSGMGFTTTTFASTTSIVINYNGSIQPVSFNGSTAISLSGALTVNDSGGSAGETLTFGNTTTYSFGSVGIWTGTTVSPGSVAINDSLTAASGSLVIGTGTTTTSPVVTFGPTGGTISSTTADIDISANTTLPILMPLSASSGTVRLVSNTGITDTSTITATNLSAKANTSGNIVLEKSNAVSGIIAFSTTAASYAASNGIAFNDSTAAATVGATTASNNFAAITGVTATNGDVNLEGLGLTINSPISASAGVVRLVESAGISQGSGGGITASSLSVSNTGSTGNAVLEATNAVSTLATKSVVSTGAITYSNGTTALTVGSVAAASATLDTGSLFNTAIAGITTTNGDVNLKSAGLTINQAIGAGTGKVRFVESNSVTQASPGTITASGLSISTTTGSVILELNNNAGTLAVTETASGSAVTYSNNTNALTIGTVAAATAALDPSGLFASVSGVTSNAGDVDLKSGALAINQPINPGILNNLRIVATGAVSQASGGVAGITASGMSVSTTTGSIILEGSGMFVGTVAFSDTAASAAVTYESTPFGATVGSIAAATATVDPSGLFGALSGISTSNGDVNLTGGGLTINNPIAAGTGTLRIFESGNVTQAVAGTITASALSMSLSGSISSTTAVLESTNAVGTIAASDLDINGSGMTYNNGATALTVGSVAAAAVAADPAGLFTAVTGIATANGDVNLNSSTLTVNNPISAGTGNVRFVAAGAVSQLAAGTITAAGLSVSTTASNIVLEANNNTGTLAAGDTTVSTSGVSFNNNTNALIVGSVAAAAAAVDPSGLFVAVAGITTANDEVDIKGGSLTINSPIAPGAANVRLVAAGNVSQAVAGTISASGFTITNSGGNDVLEAANHVGGIAVSNTSTGNALTFNNGANANTTSIVVAASASDDPSGLFGAVSGITTTNADVNLKSTTLTVGSTIFTAGTGTVRLVLTGAITENFAIIAGALSITNSSGNSVLESANVIGTLAYSNTSSGGVLSYSNGSNALTVGSVAAASVANDPSVLFAAVTGISTTNGDVNLANGALTISNPIAAGTGNVRFVASGGVSQSASGTITASGLAASSTTGSIVLEAANNAGTLAASDSASAGAVTFSNSANALIVGSIAAAASAVDPSGLFATAITGITTTNGDVNLKSSTLTVNNPVAAGTGNARFVAAGAVSQAVAGTITAAGLATTNSGGSTVLESANKVGIRTANNTSSGSAVTFNNGANALTVSTIAAAAVAADPSSLFAAVTGISTTNGDVNLKSSTLAVNNPIAAGTGTVRFVDSGNVSQLAAGTITAGALSTNNSAGNAILEAANSVGTLATNIAAAGGVVSFNDGSSALILGAVAAATAAADPNSLFGTVTGATGTDVNLKSAGLTINAGVLASGNVRLVEAGNVSQSQTITILVGGLSISSSAGSVVLESLPFNDGVPLLATTNSSTGGAVTLNNSTALTVGTVAAATAAVDPSGLFGAVSGIGTTNGDVNLQGAGLTINQAIAAGTGNVRFVESGAVTQAAAGTITAGGLSVSNSSTNPILESANDVGTLAGKVTNSGSALTFNNGANALTIGSIAAAASAVDPSSLFTAVAGITTASGDVNLKSAGLSITSTVSVNNANIRLVEAGNVSQNSSAAINATGLSATDSGGNVVLESAGNQISTLAASNTTSGGAVTINDAAPAGAIIGAVAAASAGADPGGLFAAVSAITTTGGDVNIKSNGLALNLGINAGTGNVRLVEAGTVTPSTAITAGGLSLSDSTSNLALEFTSGTPNIGTLAASNTATGGAVTLNDGTTALTIGTIAAAASAVDPSSLFVGVSGITTTNGDVNLKSGMLTINQPIAVGTGNVRLNATGSLTQAAAGTITSAGLSVSGSTMSTVLEASNNVGTLAAANTGPGGAITFNDATHALTIGTIAASPAGGDPSGLFTAVTGITTSNGDANLKSAGLTINQAIAAGTGNVRLVDAGSVSQAAAGTITAAGLSTSNSSGNTVLEATNHVTTLAASGTSSGGAVTFNNGTNALTVGSVGAAAAAADPSTLFVAVSGISTTNGDVNLKSGGLTVNSALGAGTAIVRFVDSGAITQGASGAITSAQLSMTVTGTNSITLTAASNNVSTTLAINDPNGAAVLFSNTGNPSTTGTVAAGTAAEDPSGLFPAVTGIVGKVPDLTISKTHSTAFNQGDVGDTYSIVVTNSGTGTTSGTVTVTDVVPTGMTPTAFTGTGWSTMITGQTVTATRSDSLNANTPYATLTLTVNVSASAPASLTNTATIAGGGELNRANDSSSDVTAIAASDDLSVTKTGPSNVLAGSNITYTITVSNSASYSAAQSVVLSDVLPTGETFVSQSQVSGPGFTLGASGNTVTDTISTLAPGASATFTLTVRTSGSVTLNNTATVSSSTHDLNPSNNSSTASTTLTTSADLAVSLVALESTAAAGGEFAYKVVVTNNGASDAQSVLLSDLLPSNVTLISQSQTAGPGFTLANSGNQINDTISTLPNGASSTIMIDVRVNAGTASGTVIHDTATVSSSTTDPVPGNNTSTANITVGSAGVSLVTDPFNPALTDVVANGPAGADTISVVNVGSGRVDVTMNGVTYGPFAPTGRIVVYTGNGNSIVTIGVGVTTPAFVFSGTGNNVLMNMGADNSVLVGGGGTDSIQGGSGCNILIAGAGASRLTGGPTGVASGGSVMIGGATLFDHDEGRLYSMLLDWSSAAAYATRMTELAALGMNASNMIPNNVTDQLFASTGQDWYWNVSGHDTLAGTHGGTVSI
jgi:uncharacterized repeat protein (TIGR01451 family)